MYFGEPTAKQHTRIGAYLAAARLGRGKPTVRPVEANLQVRDGRAHSRNG